MYVRLNFRCDRTESPVVFGQALRSFAFTGEEGVIYARGSNGSFCKGSLGTA
jgi:hypothetical protein